VNQVGKITLRFYSSAAAIVLELFAIEISKLKLLSYSIILAHRPYIAKKENKKAYFELAANAYRILNKSFVPRRSPVNTPL
jgi:hypothetical protein